MDRVTLKPSVVSWIVTMLSGAAIDAWPLAVAVPNSSIVQRRREQAFKAASKARRARRRGASRALSQRDGRRVLLGELPTATR